MPLHRRSRPVTVLTVFGTRPETIKLAPVIAALEARGDRFRPVNVSTAQHADLIGPLVGLFGLRIDHTLDAAPPDGSLNALAAAVMARLDPLLAATAPDLVLVQGDTTSAVSAAFAAANRGIPVGHVEAGLRTHDLASPFPEELNRRLISRLARLHFAPTAGNVAALVAEGVPADWIVETGNPVVDALNHVRRTTRPSAAVRALIERAEGRRLVLLTTHRRESFGATMRANLAALRDFVADAGDTMLVFPVHPNPAVRHAAAEILEGHPRIVMTPPLDYPDFLAVLAASWFVVSDSGGVQEEVASVGKPLLVLRDTTERPEAIDSGLARLVGGDPALLSRLLAEIAADDRWVRSVRPIANPFGDGASGTRIVAAIGTHFESVRAAGARETRA